MAITIKLNTPCRIAAYDNQDYGLNVYGDETISEGRRVCMWSKGTGSVTKAQTWRIRSNSEWGFISSELNTSYVLTKELTTDFIVTRYYRDDSDEDWKNNQLWDTRTKTDYFLLLMAKTISWKKPLVLTRSGNFNNADVFVEELTTNENSEPTDVNQMWVPIYL